MIYIGIDFSKNSPGVTIIKPTDIIFLSFTRDLDKGYTKKGEVKKAFEHHAIMKDLDDAHAISYELFITNDKKADYSENEWNKMLNGINLAATIVKELRTHIKKEEWDFVQIAFEGYSYGSKGNALIDIVTMTTTLKHMLHLLTMKKIFVFSPKQVKSLATGNGNAGKDLMFDYFLKEDLLKNSAFRHHCSSIQIANGKIPKPIDDVIDSYYIAIALIKYLTSTSLN